jgi:transposase
MLAPASFPSLGAYDAGSGKDNRRQLTDEQWFLIEELFPWRAPAPQGGRPTVPPRAVLETLLWLLRNGGRWPDLPEGAPSESTCRRRLRQWTESGTLTQVWSRLVHLADELGHVNWNQLIADGTFRRAKKGGISWDAAAKGQAPPCWSSWTATALPWAS